MKPASLIHFTIIGTLCFGVQVACLEGAPPVAEPSKQVASSGQQVRVQLEFIEVSHSLFTALTAGAGGGVDGTELRSKVDQLISQGKATIVESMLCTTLDGQKGTTDSVRQFTYPTEFEPVSLPPIGNENPRPVPSLGIGPTPTAFETHNLGSTLEVQVKVQPDKQTIQLGLVPEIVYHVGNQIWANWKGPCGDTPVQTPDMYAMRLNTSVAVRSGRPFLVAALSPKNEAGMADFSRKWMVFARADLLRDQ